MTQTQNNVARVNNPAGAQAGGLATERPAMGGRIIFLNALPLNALPRTRLQLDVLPVDIVELGHWLYERLVEGHQLIHYIRHEGTLRALQRELGIPLPPEPNSGLYQYMSGDVLVVVTLRSPVRGQEVQQVRTEDLEAWIVSVL